MNNTSDETLLKPGEPFNPWRGSCGFYAPDVVGRQRDLTDGQKRLYERLVRYAGRDGECFPSQTTLAADLGKSERQTRRDLDQLETRGLIRKRHRSRGRNSSYEFLWHSAFEQSSGDFDRPSTAGQEEGWGDSERTPASAQMEPRPDISGSLTGHPRPPNSVQEYKASESVESSDRERIRRALAFAIEKPLSPTDNLPGRLIELAQAAGADVDQLVRFIEAKAEHRSIESAGFFLRAVPEDLPGWVEVNTPAPAPRRPPRCDRCDSTGWLLTDRGATPCPACNPRPGTPGEAPKQSRADCLMPEDANTAATQPRATFPRKSGGFSRPCEGEIEALVAKSA